MRAPKFVTAGTAVTTVAAPDRPSVPPADAATEIAAGLSGPVAALSPKFLYDALGSALFTAITELPEYYPTRTERAIFEAQGSAIAEALHAGLAPGFPMVDLGAGDGAKASRLFDTLRPGRYIAVDISEQYLRGALAQLQQRWPELPMTGVGLDFASRLALPPGVVEGRALVFYPGSSIGNFDPSQAVRFLREARELSAGGALLIGADLVKPVDVLEAAYDDELGVTAAFNLNLLRHVNRLLGTDFAVRDWRHAALFNTAESRIEMHLEASRTLTVRWPGGERVFAAGEGIHTENSYKWEPADFEVLLRDAGWRHVRRWTDEQRWFGVYLAFAG